MFMASYMGEFCSRSSFFLKLLHSTKEKKVAAKGGGQSMITFINHQAKTFVIKQFTSKGAFENELCITKSLADCPFVLQPISVLESSHEMVYPCIADGDLSNLAIRNMTYSDLVCIARQIVLAISAVHRAGYLHMDIKPENIVKDGSKAWLIDFGLCVRQDDPRSMCGIGSVRTMCPDLLIFNDGRPCRATISTDWWSFGVTIYYIFSKYYKQISDDHFPYKPIYDDGKIVRLEWHTSKVLPSKELFDLLFSPDGGLLFLDNGHEWDGLDLLRNSFFN